MVKFLQKYFLTGLLAVTPLAITTWILWRLYDLISANIKPLMQKIPGLGESYPEFFLTVIGVLIFTCGITLIGIFTRNIIGGAFFRLLEGLIERIPVVKSVFSATKQISQVFLQDRRTAFQRVVVFEYPRQGIYSMGFVTRDEPSDELVNVFLPTTPNPTSGFMLMVPRDQMQELNIPVEDAIKLIISGGSIMTPKQSDIVHDHSRNLGLEVALDRLESAAEDSGKESQP